MQIHVESAEDHEDHMLNMEALLDWQQRGINARILGLCPSDNPLLKHQPARDIRLLDEWRQKEEAWLFGWAIEDAIRN